MRNESAQLTLSEVADLVEAASDVTFMGSMDGRTTWVSGGVTDLLGWAPEEIAGLPFMDLVHPEDHPAVARAREEAGAAKAIRFRVRVRTKAGAYHWIDVMLRTRFDDAGNAIARYGSWRDAEADVHLQSRLEEEAQRSRAILDGMLDPWVLFAPVRDDNGRITDFIFAEANARACEYNRMSREEMVGASLLTLLPGHRGSDLFASYVRVLQTGEPLVLDDFVYPREIFGGA